jgi:hypothetical protein
MKKVNIILVNLLFEFCCKPYIIKLFFNIKDKENHEILLEVYNKMKNRINKIN